MLTIAAAAVGIMIELFYGISGTNVVYVTLTRPVSLSISCPLLCPPRQRGGQGFGRGRALR